MWENLCRERTQGLRGLIVNLATPASVSSLESPPTPKGPGFENLAYCPFPRKTTFQKRKSHPLGAQVPGHPELTSTCSCSRHYRWEGGAEGHRVTQGSAWDSHSPG